MAETRTLWTGKGMGVTGYRQSSPSEPLDFNIYLNMRGIKDDGSGTYTGYAGALIENPADVIHYFLCVYGGVAEADIVTSGFGSFVTARGVLNDRVTWGVLNTFKIRFQQGIETTLREIIERICAQCGLNFLEPGSDGKYRLIAWKASPTDDELAYRPAASGGPVLFQRKDIRVFHPPTFAPLSSIVNEVYVNYRYEHGKNTFTRTTFVDAADSDPTWTAGEAICADSQSRFRIIRRLTIDADLLWQTGAAEWLREFAVWRLAIPLLRIDFETNIRAADMLPRQVFQLDDDCDAYWTYPVEDSDGSWDGKLFWSHGAVIQLGEKSQIRCRIRGTQA